jgi:hypothetical protein
MNSGHFGLIFLCYLEVNFSVKASTMGIWLLQTKIIEFTLCSVVHLPFYVYEISYYFANLTKHIALKLGLYMPSWCLRLDSYAMYEYCHLSGYKEALTSSC